MKHIGKFEGQQCLLLGYSRERGDRVWLVPFPRLRSSDQRELMTIISSGIAQRTDNVIPELRRQIHSTGMDWLTFVAQFGTEVPAYQVSVGDKQQATTWFGRGTSNYDPNLAKQVLSEDDDMPDGDVPEAIVPKQTRGTKVENLGTSDSVKLDLILQELASITSRVTDLELTAAGARKPARRPPPRRRKKDTKPQAAA